MKLRQARKIEARMTAAGPVGHFGYWWHYYGLHTLKAALRRLERSWRTRRVEGVATLTARKIFTLTPDFYSAKRLREFIRRQPEILKFIQDDARDHQVKFEKECAEKRARARALRARPFGTSFPDYGRPLWLDTQELSRS